MEVNGEFEGQLSVLNVVILGFIKIEPPYVGSYEMKRREGISGFRMAMQSESKAVSALFPASHRSPKSGGTSHRLLRIRPQF